MLAVCGIDRGVLVTVSLVTFLPQASHNEIADPAIPASGLKKSHNEIIGPALLKSDAKHLKQTIVTSHDKAPDSTGPERPLVLYLPTGLERSLPPGRRGHSHGE